jgi:hypothetical protein
MIEFKNDLIVFFNSQKKSEILEKHLLSGHVCPHCGVPVHGIFETGSRVDVQKYAAPTVTFTRTPTYLSYFLNSVGTVKGQVFLEQTHCGQNSVSYHSVCPYKAVVFEPKYNPDRFMGRLLSLLNDHCYLYSSSLEPLHKMWATAGSDVKDLVCAEFVAKLKQKSASYGGRPLLVEVADIMNPDGAPLYLVNIEGASRHEILERIHEVVALGNSAIQLMKPMTEELAA